MTILACTYFGLIEKEFVFKFPSFFLLRPILFQSYSASSWHSFSLQRQVDGFTASFYLYLQYIGVKIIVWRNT